MQKKKKLVIKVGIYTLLPKLMDLKLSLEVPYCRIRFIFEKFISIEKYYVPISDKCRLHSGGVY